MLAGKSGRTFPQAGGTCRCVHFHVGSGELRGVSSARGRPWRGRGTRGCLCAPSVLSFRPAGRFPAAFVLLLPRSCGPTRACRCLGCGLEVSPADARASDESSALIASPRSEDVPLDPSQICPRLFCFPSLLLCPFCARAGLSLELAKGWFGNCRLLLVFPPKT